MDKWIIEGEELVSSDICLVLSRDERTIKLKVTHIGTYRFTFPDLNTINISLHDYDSSYWWINFNSHSAECGCGAVTIEPYAISNSSFSSGQRFTICLLCGGSVEMGFIQFNANLSSVNNVTINGS